MIRRTGICLLILPCTIMAHLEAQSVSINTDATDAHPGAILDV
ncbi:MAG: hypothetical protein R3301_16835 [Saprospiraceae bacterium]|nr:hypothetical protein [Saprospiraceae bacterium]